MVQQQGSHVVVQRQNGAAWAAGPAQGSLSSPGQEFSGMREAAFKSDLLSLPGGILFVCVHNSIKHGVYYFGLFLFIYVSRVKLQWQQCCSSNKQGSFYKCTFVGWWLHFTWMQGFVSMAFNLEFGGWKIKIGIQFQYGVITRSGIKILLH